MKSRTAFALSFLLAATGFARADSTPTADGFWEVRDSDGNPTAWFLFTDKDDVFSGRLVKGFQKPGDDKPPQTICTQCPGKKKGAHVMGLTLFWGMKRDGLHYDDGSVLDPRDGTVYHALMNLSDDGQQLEVRGYVGIKMFGKSQIWYRLPDDVMKTEDIPKEILANDEDASSDKAADKPKAASKSKHEHVTADKAKAHKSKSAKAKGAAPSPDASDAANSPNASPDSGAQQPGAQ